MDSDVKHQPLFNPGKKKIIGVGFPNINDVLRASNEKVFAAIEHYQQRCGHIPFGSTEKSYVYVSEKTQVIKSQLDYLSKVFNKTIEPKTAQELNEQSQKTNTEILFVPYINVSQTQHHLRSKFTDPKTWGLPSSITDALKNKASSHELVSKSELNDLRVPEFTILQIDDLLAGASEFLAEKVKKLYSRFSLENYPLGLMVRFAECDGNYGAGVLKAEEGKITFLPDGNSEKIKVFDNWHEALSACQEHIKSTINPEIENRVVVTRLIDTEDSPAMSVAILGGEIISLGMNGQLQGEGTACIGTTSFTPKSEYLKSRQPELEEKTLAAFSKLLKKVALAKGEDFNKLRAFANIDIIIPGELERNLQLKKDGEVFNYFSECNPRFTNWTDGVLTGVAAESMDQTISSMEKIIARGIQNVDKFKLPAGTDINILREKIYALDQSFKNEGTRIIVRMCENPMGIIFIGDIQKAKEQLSDLVNK